MEEKSYPGVFSYKAHCGSSSGRNEQHPSNRFLSQVPPKVPSSVGREIATEATNLFLGAKPRIPTLDMPRFSTIEVAFFPELQRHEDLIRQAENLLQSENTERLSQLAKENESPVCRMSSYFASISEGDEIKSIEAFDLLDRTKIPIEDLPEFYRVVDQLRQHSGIMVTSPPPLFVINNSE